MVIWDCFLYTGCFSYIYIIWDMYLTDGNMYIEIKKKKIPPSISVYSKYSTEAKKNFSY